jgi:hypothetical protein
VAARRWPIETVSVARCAAPPHALHAHATRTPPYFGYHSCAWAASVPLGDRSRLRKAARGFVIRVTCAGLLTQGFLWRLTMMSSGLWA